MSSGRSVGALATLLDQLAAQGVTVRGIGAAQLGGEGAVCLVTDDDAATGALLAQRGDVFESDEAIEVEIEDTTAALSRVIRRLADCDADISSLVITNRGAGKLTISLSCDRVDAARLVLGREVVRA